ALAIAPEDVETRYRLAQVLEEHLGRGEDAIEQYAALASLRPREGRWLLLLGVRRGSLLLGQGGYAGAAAWFQGVLDMRPGPGYADVRVGLGEALCRMGRFQEAETQLRMVLAERPNYPDALGALGRLYAASGRDADAVATYQAAIASDPQSALLH